MSDPVVTLDEVAAVNPRLSDRPEGETPVSFLGMADVDSSTGTTTVGEDRRFGDVSTGYTQFIDSDLLIAKITPCFENGKIAQASLTRPQGAGSTEFHVVRPDTERIDARFLLHFLRQPHIRLTGEMRMTGSAGQRRIPDTFIRQLKIPALPMSKQRQIAQALDQVDALRAKRREAISLLDNLTQSIFLDMFGDSRLDGVSPTRLGDVSEVQGGLQLSGKRKTLPSSMPYLRVANVYRNRLDLAELKHIQISENEARRTGLHAGDLLVVEGHGNPGEIGRVAVWDGSVEPCTHQNHLIRARVDQAIILPEFASFYLNSPVGRRHLLSSANTTSGLNTINVSAVKHTPIVVPSLGLQRDFVDKLSRVRRLASSHQHHLSELDALFASLQHRVFRGKLWEDAADSAA